MVHPQLLGINNCVASGGVWVPSSKSFNLFRCLYKSLKTFRNQHYVIRVIKSHCYPFQASASRSHKLAVKRLLKKAVSKAQYYVEREHCLYPWSQKSSGRDKGHVWEVLSYLVLYHP